MKMRPNALRSWLTSAYVDHHLPKGSRPRVLLSFDDGPTAEVTTGVLERLAAAEARAVFFVIGSKVEKHPELVAAVAAAKHAVGNHSHTHPCLRWPSSGPYLDDVRQCSVAIENATGELPVFFRAPEGRLHPPSIWGSRRLGLRHVLWSLDSQDWTCNNADDARKSAERVLAEVKDGDIILLHEFALWTWDLLDVLLPGLQERGFDLGSGLHDLT